MADVSGIIARLGVSIDGRQAKTEAAAVGSRIRGMGRSAREAERSFNPLSRAMRRSSRAAREMSASSAAAETQVKALGRRVQALGVAAGAFAGFAVGIGGFTAFAASAKEYADALGEVRTLTDETFGDIKELTRASKQFAGSFGLGEAQQLRASYQIISAGATNAGDAVKLLNVANQLAVAGVTDVDTAADLLTTTLNAYSLSADEAARVSDLLINTVRAGKTTIPELAGALGAVLPVSAALGLSLEELLAALAGLTKGGIATRRAAFGLRAFFQTVLRPQGAGLKLIESAGLDYNQANLQKKGTVGFLREIDDALDSNTEKLTLALQTQEALVPGLALIGPAGTAALETIDLFRDGVGATEVAAKKVASELGNRLDRATAKIGATFREVGEGILEKFVPAMEDAADSIGQLKDSLAALGREIKDNASLAWLFGAAGVGGTRFGRAAARFVATRVALPVAGAAALLSIGGSLNRIQGYRDYEAEVRASDISAPSRVAELEARLAAAERDLERARRGGFPTDLYEGRVRGARGALRVERFRTSPALEANLALNVDEAARRGFGGFDRRNEAALRALLARPGFGPADAAEVRRIYGGLTPEELKSRIAAGGITEERIRHVRGLNDRIDKALAVGRTARGFFGPQGATRRYVPTFGQTAAVVDPFAAAGEAGDELRARRDRERALFLQTVVDPGRYAGRRAGEFAAEYGTNPAEVRNLVSLTRGDRRNPREDIKAVSDAQKELNEAQRLAENPLLAYKDALKDNSRFIQNEGVSAIQELSSAFAEAVIGAGNLRESLVSLFRNVGTNIAARGFENIIGSLIPSFGKAADGALIKGPSIGLAGEAGPEAILPLKRGRGGRLGVEASGAGGGGVVVNLGGVRIERREGEDDGLAAVRGLEAAFESYFDRESRPGGRLDYLRRTRG